MTVPKGMSDSLVEASRLCGVSVPRVTLSPLTGSSVHGAHTPRIHFQNRSFALFGAEQGIWG